MNAPLRRVAVACLLLFGLLFLNVNYVQVVKADSYRNDTRNARGLLRSYAHERGPIVLSTGGGGATTAVGDFSASPGERRAGAAPGGRCAVIGRFLRR